MYKGKKIKLREYRKEDINLVLEYINDAELKRNLSPGIPYPMTLQDEEKWFESNSAMNDKYSFAIETLEDSLYIGGCSIHSVDWKNSVVVVGIFIGNKDYWSKGYGTDAMQVLIQFIFDQMNINKIKLQVYSFNKRAIKSYKKCGFVEEGVFRQEIFKDGCYYDEIQMGLLREEYKQIRKNMR